MRLLAKTRYIREEESGRLDFTTKHTEFTENLMILKDSVGWKAFSNVSVFSVISVVKKDVLIWKANHPNAC